MRKQRSDTRETQQRLLDAASKVFAEKGFWEASNADICKKAQVNTAAISYHFGGKDQLYVAAWKHAFAQSMQAYPPDGGVAAPAPAQDRLRGRVLAMMQRIADPDNYEVEIMLKEIANPTGILTEAIRQVLEPMHQHTRAIVQELLGNKVDEPQINLCVMSVMSQCFGPMLRLRQTRKESPSAPPSPLPLALDIEELADHIIQFSLAGIREIRQTAPRG